VEGCVYEGESGAGRGLVYIVVDDIVDLYGGHFYACYPKSYQHVTILLAIRAISLRPRFNVMPSYSLKNIESIFF